MWGTAMAVVAAFGASLCCIGPIAAALFGISSLAALSQFEFLRPWLAGMTVIFLAAGFYLVYREPKECRSGSLCETRGVERVGRWNRIAIWIAAVIAAVVLTFPEWSVLLL
jgi:mercuric ion transport protein